MSKPLPIPAPLCGLSVLALGLLTAISPAAAQTAPPTATSPAAQTVPSPRETIPFDAGWKWHLGDDAAAKDAVYDDAGWRSLNVPHDWSIEQPINLPPEGEPNGGFFSHGIGWYRKSFTLPPAELNKKVVIEFDGVYMNSDVWINGQLLGHRPYGFIGFRYDLSEYLKTDGT